MTRWCRLVARMPGKGERESQRVRQRAWLQAAQLHTVQQGVESLPSKQSLHAFIQHAIKANGLTARLITLSTSCDCKTAECRRSAASQGSLSRHMTLSDKLILLESR